MPRLENGKGCFSFESTIWASFIWFSGVCFTCREIQASCFVYLWDFYGAIITIASLCAVTLCMWEEQYLLQNYPSPESKRYLEWLLSYWGSLKMPSSHRASGRELHFQHSLERPMLEKGRSCFSFQTNIGAGVLSLSGVYTIQVRIFTILVCVIFETDIEHLLPLLHLFTWYWIFPFGKRAIFHFLKISDFIYIYSCTLIITTQS